MRFSLGSLAIAVLLATPLATAKTHHLKEKSPAHHRSLVRNEDYGVASWYGKEHQGRKMANGQPFDRFKLTAASRTLPLGSRIVVTGLFSGESVTVTITDRGPWTKSRILDLSEAAAKAIDCHGTCTVSITPEIVDHEDHRPTD